MVWSGIHGLPKLLNGAMAKVSNSRHRIFSHYHYRDACLDCCCSAVFKWVRRSGICASGHWSLEVVQNQKKNHHVSPSTLHQKFIPQTMMHFAFRVVFSHHVCLRLSNYWVTQNIVFRLPSCLVHGKGFRNIRWTLSTTSLMTVSNLSINQNHIQ